MDMPMHIYWRFINISIRATGVLALLKLFNLSFGTAGILITFGFFLFLQIVKDIQKKNDLPESVMEITADEIPTSVGVHQLAIVIAVMIASVIIIGARTLVLGVFISYLYGAIPYVALLIVFCVGLVVFSVFMFKHTEVREGE